MQRSAGRCLLLVALCGCGGSGVFGRPPPGDDVDATAAPPVTHLAMNEVASAGDDWIELFNPLAAALPLAGWALRDGEGDPAPLDPSLAVPPRGHLLLRADGAPELGPDHLPFRLDREGAALTLLDPAGELVDALALGPLAAGFALARRGDGVNDWDVVVGGTPGSANGGGAARPVGTAGCGPVVAVDSAVVEEGEAFRVTVSCADGVLGAHDVVAVARDGQGTLARATGVFTRPTGLADAGRHEVVFAVYAEGRGGVPQTAVARVDVLDAFDAAGNVPANPARYLAEHGLPVLHLLPERAVGEEYVPVEAWYAGRRYAASMKIRGAASASYDKNHFTVRFDPEQLDLEAEGLGRKERLVLLSNFDDNAYIRQKLVFDTWAAMAETSPEPRIGPRSFWLVVFLGGAYHGLYLGLDHVDRELVREQGFAEASNLYKSVNHDANFYLQFSDGGTKEDLTAGWEKKEGSLEDWSDLEDLVAWSATATHAEFADEVDGWLARDEFVDWLLLVKWFAAADSAGKNAYLAHDVAPDALDARFHYIPWDFNHALGQDWRTLRVPVSWSSDFKGGNGIFRHLQEEPGLAAQVWARYSALRQPGEPLAPDALLALGEAQYAAIEPSCRRDEARWGAAYASYWGWAFDREAAGDLLDFAGERAYVERWIVERAAAEAERHPL